MGFIGNIKELFSFGNTLYYPGCLTKFASPNIEDNYIRILNNISLDFIHVPEFYCCGKPVSNAGYKEDWQNLKDKNAELFKKYGIKKIITNCPSCFHEFGKYEGITAIHATQAIAKKLNKIKGNFQKGDITYKEPCHLGRKSGIYDPPREILRHLGFNIVELDNTREHSLCCGAGGGLKTNNPELSNKIAEKWFKTIKTKKVVTSCPLCYMQLKENAPSGIKVYELSEVILNKIKE
ncbi:MAG: (Fe-S)-binding protein [Candidatus Woesearchaeota archaeon]